MSVVKSIPNIMASSVIFETAQRTQRRPKCLNVRKFAQPGHPDFPAHLFFSQNYMFSHISLICIWPFFLKLFQNDQYLPTMYFYKPFAVIILGHSSLGLI
jgi:hypothetical protein